MIGGIVLNVLTGKKSAPYRYLLPTVVLMIVFMVIPIFMVITYSFADKAVASTGLAWSPVKDWDDPTKLFDYLKSPTPLQNYAATVELEDGPQLFLLEDVTGAGKTEAALILTQRLMQAGRGAGPAPRRRPSDKGAVALLQN